MYIYSMKLDYQIINLLHPHHERGRGCVYDDINWTVWFSNEGLLSKVNNHFSKDFKLNEKCVITREEADSIWEYITELKRFIGTYGANYDCDIRMI